MSFLVRPLMNQPGDGPDEIDRLLSRFYQAEMPHPWPDCPAPEESSVRVMVPERQSSWLELSQRFASRLALALSLAVLLGGAYLLSGSFSGPGLSNEQSPAPVVARHPIELLPATADRGSFRVTEQFVQPKDGPTKMNIEIIEIVPPSPR